MIEKKSLRQEKSYKEVLELQLEEFNYRVQKRKEGIPMPGDIIFFVEHRPVLTIGKHGHHSNLLVSEQFLASHGIEFMELGRGGDITYHGPGQLTVYPILDMMRYHLGVKDYVWLLEEAVINTISNYGIKGDRIEGKTGVWLGKGTPHERKISAIGIKCSRFVSMHGLSLNVGPDLSGFSLINPCGLSQEVTSLSIESDLELSLDEVENLLWENLNRLLLPRILSQGNS